MLRYLISAAGAGLGALVLQACATSEAMAPEPNAEAAAVLADFERTGETQTCLNTRRIDTINPLDERHWLVETVGGERYLNIVGRGCFGADTAFTFLSYETPTSQLCRGEIVRVMDRGTAGGARGSCGLGVYERLSPAE